MAQFCSNGLSAGVCPLSCKFSSIRRECQERYGYCKVSSAVLDETGSKRMSIVSSILKYWVRLSAGVWPLSGMICSIGSDCQQRYGHCQVSSAVLDETVI